MSRILATFPTLALIALALAATPALAHTGLEPAAGALSGFIHPFLGLDHVLAMLAVGALAFQRGGRAVVIIPAVFVLVMGAGGAVAGFGYGLPMVETMIALSLVVLGLMIAARIPLPGAVAAAVVGAFALFHGHAHVAEVQGSLSAAGYTAGFMAATAILHGIGIGLAWAITSASVRRAEPVLRGGGGLVAAAGIAFLVTQL
jgi:urease accessory protein